LGACPHKEKGRLPDTHFSSPVADAACSRSSTYAVCKIRMTLRSAGKCSVRCSEEKMTNVQTLRQTRTSKVMSDFPLRNAESLSRTRTSRTCQSQHLVRTTTYQTTTDNMALSTQVLLHHIPPNQSFLTIPRNSTATTKPSAAQTLPNPSHQASIPSRRTRHTRFSKDTWLVTISKTESAHGIRQSWCTRFGALVSRWLLTMRDSWGRMGRRA
jgi:hypothetical protein